MATQSYFTIRMNGVNMFYQTGTVTQASTQSSTLNTSIYSIWNGDTLGTSLDTSVYNAWNMELSGSTLANSLDSGAYLALNGDLISSTVADDAVGSNNATLYNGATAGTGIINNALVFDGTNDYAELPANAMDSLTSEFTMSMWLNTPNLSNARGWYAFTEQTRTTNSNQTNEIDRGIAIYTPNASTLTFWSNLGVDFTVSSTSLNTSIGVAPNTWFHVTVSYKQGVGAYIYINGMLNASTTTANALTRTATTIARLGVTNVYYNGSTNKTGYYQGKIEGFTVWNRKLTDSEISKVYNSSVGITYPFSNKTLYGAYDLVNSIHGTASGYLPVSTGISNKALYVPTAVGNYIGLPDNSLSSLLSGDFSVSFWLYTTQTAANTSVPFCYMSNPSANVYNGFEIVISGLTPQFKVYPNTALASGVLLQSPSAITNNTWQHIVITRRYGARSTIYINGTSVVSNTSSSNPTVSGTFLATIGRERYAAVSQYNLITGSKLDSVVTWTKELTSDEVIQLYNAGTGADYPYSSQTLPSKNNQFAIDNAVLTNGCTFTTGKIGKAFTFDGVNDYVALVDNSLNFTGDYSASAWVYVPSAYIGTDSIYVMANMYTSSWGINFKGFSFRLSGNTLEFLIGDGSSYNGNTGLHILTYSYNYTTSQWYHVAFSRKSGVGSKLYLNGSLVASNTDTTNPVYHTTHTPTIGNIYIPSVQNSYFAPANTRIDGLSVWNKELTASEITELYNSGSGQQLTIDTKIVTKDILFNYDANRISSYPATDSSWPGTLYDNSGNNNHMTLMSFLTSVVLPADNSSGTPNNIGYIRYGIKGFVFNYSALGSNGSTNYGKVPLSTTVDSNGYTFGGWVRNVSGGAEAFTKGSDSLYGSWSLSLYFGGGTISLSIINASSQSASVSGSYTDTIDQWYYITGQYIHGSGLKVFVNGQLVNSMTQGATAISLRNSPGWTIAKPSSTAKRCVVSTYHAYNRVLTSTEILQNFNATKSYYGY